MSATHDDQILTAWLDANAPAREPDHLLEAVLGRTARTPRRAAWRFPERWLPMDTVATRRVTPNGVPLRWLAATALLVLALVVGAVLAAGSRRTQVPAPAYGPADDGRIVYGASGQLFVRDSLTGRSTVLVAGPNVFAPEFSRDGTRLAFLRAVGGPGQEHALAQPWVARADGSDAQPLDGTYPNVGSFTWSPSGDALAVTYDGDGGRRHLAIVPADGSPARMLLGDTEVDQVAWRPPDGRQLVVRIRPPQVDVWTLALINADGSGLTSLNFDPGYRNDEYFTVNRDFYFLSPDWSPDGTRLAFHTLEDVFGPGDNDPGFRVHVADIGHDGAVSNERQLPTDQAIDDEFDPIWTPDGSGLVVKRVEENVPSLVIAPLDGPERQVDLGLPTLPQFDPAGLVMAPDGKDVFAWHDRNDDLHLPQQAWRIDLGSGAAERVDLPIDDSASWQRVGHPGS